MDLSPLYISLKTSIAAIIITFILGVLCAWLIVSIKNKKVRAVIDGILTLPLVLPPTVAGFYLLYVFGVYRPVGKFILETFHYKIAFSWSATVIAAVVMSFPLMYRNCVGSFEQVNPDLMNAGRTLGMSEWDIFWKIQFANARPGVLSGAILAYARGLGEFGATNMLAGNIAGVSRTLPIAVWAQVAAGNYESAYVYVYILVAIAMIAVVGMNIAGNYKRKKTHKK